MPKGKYSRPSDEERFWSRVDKHGPMAPRLKSRCWIWTGATLKCKNGNYGLLKARGRCGFLAHRFSWEINVGPIPNRLNVCHHCDNPTCVNPAHLFVGDNRANAADRDAKGRQVIRKGEQFTHSKLTDNAVRFIRTRYIPKHPIYGSRAMARRFGVSSTVVKWVRQNKIWKHVT